MTSASPAILASLAQRRWVRHTAANPDAEAVLLILVRSDVHTHSRNTRRRVFAFKLRLYSLHPKAAKYRYTTLFCELLSIREIFERYLWRHRGDLFHQLIRNLSALNCICGMNAHHS
jgi:hypothetical protein